MRRRRRRRREIEVGNAKPASSLSTGGEKMTTDPSAQHYQEIALQDRDIKEARSQDDGGYAPLNINSMEYESMYTKAVSGKGAKESGVGTSSSRPTTSSHYTSIEKSTLEPTNVYACTHMIGTHD